MANVTDWSALSLALNASGANESELSPLGDEMEPQFYSYRYRIVGTLFQGAVLLAGVLGNAMVMLAVKRTPALRSPTHCYLVSLAAADCVVLLSSVPNELLSYYLVGNRWVWGGAGCAGFIFAQHLGISAASLTLVALTVDRYIAICQPLRAQQLCTVGRAKRVAAALWLLAVLYCAPWLGLTATRPLRYRGYRDLVFCDFKLPRSYYLTYFFADLLVFYVAPLALSCVLYSLIARALFHRKAAHTHHAEGKPNGTLHASAPASASSPNATPAASADAAATDRWKLVRMLAVVVGLFAALWLPYRAMLVYNSFATLFHKEKFMDLWFLMFAKTCVYINSAINPILYNALSGRFRRAFRRLLLCAPPPQGAGGGGGGAGGGGGSPGGGGGASASSATASSALQHAHRKSFSKSSSGNLAIQCTEISTFRESPSSVGGGGGLAGAGAGVGVGTGVGALGQAPVDVVADAAAAHAAHALAQQAAAVAAARAAAHAANATPAHVITTTPAPGFGQTEL